MKYFFTSILVFVFFLEPQSQDKLTPRKVSASNYQDRIKNRGKWITFEPEHLIDGDEKTMWVDGHNTGDVWAKFDFDQSVMISEITIHSGAWVNDNMWRINSRPKHLLITTSHGYEKIHKLPYRKAPHPLKIKNAQANWVKIKIIDSYYGTIHKYEQGPISEVHFNGESATKYSPGVTNLKLAIGAHDIFSKDLKQIQKSIKVLKKDKVEIDQLVFDDGTTPIGLSMRRGDRIVTDFLLDNGVRLSTVTNPATGKYFRDKAEIGKYLSNAIYWRTEYHNVMNGNQSRGFSAITLKSSNLEEILALSDKINTEIQHYLFRSEVDELLIRIKEKRNTLANKEIKRLFEEERKLEYSFETIESLKKFESKYPDIWHYTSPEVRKEIYIQINKTTKTIITELVNNWKNKLVEKERTIENAHEIELFLSAFEKEFQGYESYGQFRVLRGDIRKKVRYYSNLERINKEKAEANAIKQFGFTFNTIGLPNSELFQNLFKGRFIEIPFDRSEILFAGLIGKYMYTYAESCPAYLPNDKVQIYEDVCSKESVTTNGWGVEVDRTCIEWVQQGTGLYASPDLYSAYELIQRINSNNSVKVLFKFLSQGLEKNIAVASDVSQLESDIVDLIERNGCDNKALKRMEDNIVQFARNNPPIQLDGTILNNSADYSQRQDLEKLTRDLVMVNTKSWAYRYIPNSVTNIRVTSYDNEKRPLKISADYKFEGLFGIQKDKLIIRFKDGLPDCILFPNYSGGCNTADRQIVANFVKGHYIVY
jgi:hypothetical protein